MLNELVSKTILNILVLYVCARVIRDLQQNRIIGFLVRERSVFGKRVQNQAVAKKLKGKKKEVHCCRRF